MAVNLLKYLLSHIAEVIAKSLLSGVGDTVKPNLAMLLTPSSQT
jgi:hypothetical protein